jgi:hypothetical protein
MEEAVTESHVVGSALAGVAEQCGVAKSYRPVLRDQPMLLSADFRERLPPHHLVWFVLETVEVLDTSGLERTTRRRRGAGAAGCDPRMSLALCQRVDLLPGPDQRIFIDIESLLRPVYGHSKQGASYGQTTKIAGKQVLRKEFSPLATTISTRTRRSGGNPSLDGQYGQRPTYTAGAASRRSGIDGWALDG